MITIRSEVKGLDTEEVEVIDKVYHACRNEPNLSPRSRKELLVAYKEGRLLMALDKSSPIGWILRIPFSKNSQELAAAYVSEHYRSKGIFIKLLEKAIKQNRTSILVTFNIGLANRLIQKMGFKESSLWEVIKISRGEFLFNRLTIEKLVAIFRHFQKGRPTYLIFSKNG